MSLHTMVLVMQVEKNQRARKWQRNEEMARHSLFMFLLMLILVEIYLMSMQEKKQKEIANAAWLSWSVAFVILAEWIMALVPGKYS
jgi:NADH:ubiquinone oxidoreductase subunit 6 (subunit J)